MKRFPEIYSTGVSSQQVCLSVDIFDSRPVSSVWLFIWHRAKCKNPHTVDSPANHALLQRAGVSELSKQELCCLLLQNDPYLLPEVSAVLL